MNTCEIRQGDCLDLLRQMPDESINCCITSPPYWGLRDYGSKGQIGLEPTPQEYVEKMRLVFLEIKRVVKKDGTLWLNLGDSYAGVGGYSKKPEGKDHALWSEAIFYERPAKRGVGGDIKQKDLVGIPWRVAFALQSDGWYLRQDIIWHKPNPMPEPVRDRCTKAHEYIFLLSKEPKYYFDSDAIKEPVCSNNPISSKEYRESIGRKSGINETGRWDDTSARSKAIGNSEDGQRNKRSVWTVTTKSYAGAHFATFPPDLITPCILAGCPTGGTVLDPFGGSGTTGQVAIENGRNAILLELNPEYVKLAEQRIKTTQPPLFVE